MADKRGQLSAETIQDWYRQSKDQHNDWRTEARECYDLVAGWHWSKAEEEEVKEKRRIPVVMNRIGPYVDAIVGYQVNNRKEIRYLPRETSDSALAELRTEARRWADDLCDAEDEITDAFSDMVISGMGWTDTRMDYAVDPDGRLVTAERIDPLETYWDVNANKRNLSDATYVIHARKMDRSEAEKRWPILKKITPTYADDEDITHTPLDGTRTDYDESGRESKDSGAERPYLILRCQWYKDETIYRVADPQSGQLVNLEQEKFDKLKDMLDAQGVRYVKSSRRHYYQSFVTGDVVLEEGDGPSQEGFTIRAMCAKRDRNRKMWYGIVRAWKDPQKFSNKFFSDILYILATNRKGGAFIETGALNDPRKAEENWADPGALIKLNPGGLSKIKERDSGDYPQGLDRLMQFAINSIADVSGMNPELIGMADRAQAGVLEEQRKQAGLTILAPLFDALKRHSRERGRVVLDMMKRFISDGRLIRIVGDEGQQMMIPLLGRPDEGTYDIIVDEMSNSSNSKQETFLVLRELIPFLGKMGIPVPPSFVKYLPIPNTLAEEWKQMLQPKQKQPDPKIMLEMQKLQLQQKEIEIKARLEEIKLQRQGEEAMQEAALDREERMLRAQELMLKQAELRLRAQEAGQSAILDSMKIEAQNFENMTDVAQAELKLRGDYAKAAATRQKAEKKVA